MIPSRFPLAAERIERDFWHTSDLLVRFMVEHGVRPFDPEDTRSYTVAVSEEYWQLARHHAEVMGDRVPVEDRPRPGYHRLFGYSIAVDPLLQRDEFRLEDRR